MFGAGQKKESLGGADDLAVRNHLDVASPFVTSQMAGFHLEAK